LFVIGISLPLEFLYVSVSLFFTTFLVVTDEYDKDIIQYKHDYDTGVRFQMYDDIDHIEEIRRIDFRGYDDESSMAYINYIIGT
jgi:hypothetical protein